MPKGPKPVEFVQIAPGPDDDGQKMLYALDKYGRVWVAQVAIAGDAVNAEWFPIDAPEDD